MNEIHAATLESLDLNLFTVFAAVYRRRNLTLAGGDLNLSQSAVSHALGRLRSRFGDPLFIRQGNLMEPTALAESIASGILSGLEMLEGAVRDVGSFDPAKARRTFRIGMNDYGSALVLPVLTERIRREASGVSLHVVHTTHEERLRMLEEGELDAVMGCHPISGRHILSADLIRDREACVVQLDHPLAAGGLEPSRFDGVPFIALSLSVSGKNVLDSVLEKTGYALAPVVTIQQELAVPELVRKTGLAGTMAERLARLTVHGEELSIRPLPFPDAEFTLRLFWHASRDAEAGQRWLRECIFEVTAALPPLGPCTEILHL
ncbi:LysR family transcriptional regulator [Desulfovibrio mangrovi]|uniref:LysR family transcriptional regulator n=1 Tax=Desulfovibrio mangrovi TaxID=2976983 RepID=UPI002247D818|nr:LysR family transcriptional regulator [Desulfovibrio mangrovi]UZP65825.1 LysR family transcriptional regulator [Desulfovibrio mangrovi]